MRVAGRWAVREEKREGRGGKQTREEPRTERNQENAGGVIQDQQQRKGSEAGDWTGLGCGQGGKC